MATHNTQWIEQHAFDLIILSRGVTLGNGTIGFYSNYKFRDFRKEYRVLSAAIDDQEIKERFFEFVSRDQVSAQIDPFSKEGEIVFRATKQAAERIEEDFRDEVRIQHHQPV